MMLLIIGQPDKRWYNCLNIVFKVVKGHLALYLIIFFNKKTPFITLQKNVFWLRNYTKNLLHLFVKVLLIAMLSKRFTVWFDCDLQASFWYAKGPYRNLLVVCIGTNPLQGFDSVWFLKITEKWSCVCLVYFLFLNCIGSIL